MNINMKIKERKRILLHLTSSFCDQFLDEEYKELCQKVINKLSRKRNVPFISGRIEIWAAGTIYALGQMNFLFDKSFEPYLTTDDICDYFKTNKSTTSQRAKRIRDMLGLEFWHPEFSTSYMRENNPFTDILSMIPKDMLFVSTDLRLGLRSNPPKPENLEPIYFSDSFVEIRKTNDIQWDPNQKKLFDFDVDEE